MFHSEYGLELVHRLLNHATEQWRRAQEAGDPIHPPRTPLPLAVRLESGPVEVYGDEHAFAWCGHAGLAPDLVASALMALELWLDRQIESGKEPPAALFDRVLRGTRSAAVVGVCCTAALRHKDRSAEAVLPILANPAFWIMDTRRMGADMQAGPYVQMRAMFFAKGRTTTKGYAQSMRWVAERCKIGHLSAFAGWLLFRGPAKAREKMQGSLEAFPENTPVFFREDAQDEQAMKMRHRCCQVWSKQAYADNYTCSTSSENAVVITFDADRLLTSDERRVERHDLARKKILKFLMWSSKLLHENKAGKGFTIASALEYDREITEDSFVSSLPRYYATCVMDARANFVGALIVHHWDMVVEAGMANACLKNFEELASAIGPRIGDEASYIYGADRAVARALPHYHLRGGRSRGAKKAIRKFADAYNAEVLGRLMRGLCVLWGREDGLVLECIAKARRRFRNQKDAFGRPYTDWSGCAAVLPALHGAPTVSGGTGRRLDRIVDDMLDDTIAAFEEFEKNCDYEGTYMAFHNAWCPHFFRILESRTAGRPALRDHILAKIASRWEAAPPLLEGYMRWILLWGMEAGRKDDLLAAWKQLLPMVIRSKFAAGYYRDEGTKKSIFSMLLFADPQGTGGSPERLGMLDEFMDETSSWCEALAGNNAAIEIIATLMASAPPPLLLAHGIGWIWTLLQPADRNGLSRGTIKLLSRALYNASTCERPVGGLSDLHDKYAWVVDCLVSLNDPAAESLRDGGKNPYECARGPRRG